MSEKAEVEILVTQDLSSGRVHKRVRIPGRPGLASYEGCNLDQAGDFSVVTIDGEGISPINLGDEATIPFSLCRNCFPADDDARYIAVADTADDDGSTHDESEPA